MHAHRNSYAQPKMPLPLLGRFVNLKAMWSTLRKYFRFGFRGSRWWKTRSSQRSLMVSCVILSKGWRICCWSVQLIRHIYTHDLTPLFIMIAAVCSFSNNPHLFGEGYQNLPKILSIFAEILETSLIDDNLIQRIVRILKQLQSNNLPQELLQKAWTSLPQEQQLKLQRAIAMWKSIKLHHVKSA